MSGSGSELRIGRVGYWVGSGFWENPTVREREKEREKESVTAVVAAAAAGQHQRGEATMTGVFSA